MPRPKLTKANIDRLDLSERLAEEWENLTGVADAVSENLRLIENEIKILGDLRSADPDRVDALIAKYSAFRDALQRKIV